MPPTSILEATFHNNRSNTRCSFKSHDNDSDDREKTLNCSRCGYVGCDIKLVPCGCSFHTRCLPLPRGSVLTTCTQCSSPVSAISLFPMSFAEIDDAVKVSNYISQENKSQVRKRKSSAISNDDCSHSISSDEVFCPVSCPAPETKARRVSIGTCSNMNEESDLRTGRWTSEEMNFCDKLVALFKDGKIPLSQGVKLNEFLASMLKSKQSRLTKKMKNAKLSSNSYTAFIGYVDNQAECVEFSMLEDNFLKSIQNLVERAEIKFHLRKEWRDMFSSYAVEKNIPIDAHAFVQSLEEMERRISSAKDAARRARRKLMMHRALNHDSALSVSGVFIDREPEDIIASQIVKSFSDPNINGSSCLSDDDLFPLLDDGYNTTFLSVSRNDGKSDAQSQYEFDDKSSAMNQSPFLSKVADYVKRHSLPFEYLEAWVPAHTCPNDQVSDATFRLYFAGSTIVDTEVPACGGGSSAPITSEAKFNLASFADYSQKFSFAKGCGIPGSIYEDGLPTWKLVSESKTFERTGGSSIWSLKTVAGLPINSPTVGRIVIMLFSRHERAPSIDSLRKLCQEMVKFPPTPKWKLIVDVGEYEPCKEEQKSAKSQSESACHNHNIQMKDIISLLDEHVSLDVTNPIVDGMVHLRIMLLRPSRTKLEEEVTGIVIASYVSYLNSGRSKMDIAQMLARDFLFLRQHHEQSTNDLLSQMSHAISDNADEAFWDHNEISDESSSDSIILKETFCDSVPSLPSYIL